MTSKKQVDDDNDTVGSSTGKTDEHEETPSKPSDSDSDDDTSSNASSEYEVEKILARRRRRGVCEFYIKWVGYDDSANEWIPESSLNCPERLAAFEREEALKRKRSQKERTSNQKRRSRSSRTQRTKKRRVKQIIDDDDEDDEDEDRQDSEHDDDNDDDDEEEERTNKTTKSIESSPTTSNHSDRNTTNQSITYGVEKGYVVQAILGINRKKGDQLHYLVHYKSPTDFDDNMELIPANIAKKFCEEEIIQFYETRIAWNNQQND